MTDPNGGNAGTDNGNQGATGADGAGTNGTTTGAPATGSQNSGQSFSQADVDRIVADRITRERGKFKDYDDLKNKAGEFDKLQDSQKSELQREAEKRTAAEAELAVLRVDKVRRDAAAKVGLSADLAEFITATDQAEAEAQAKRLADRVKPPEATPPPAGSPRPGVRQNPQPGQTPDAWLRAMAGRS
jgi:hypothetical protein